MNSYTFIYVPSNYVSNELPMSLQDILSFSCKEKCYLNMSLLSVYLSVKFAKFKQKLSLFPFIMPKDHSRKFEILLNVACIL